jgi:hypothetical protein
MTNAHFLCFIAGMLIGAASGFCGAMSGMKRAFRKFEENEERGAQ